jgi:hypothetical protein
MRGEAKSTCATMFKQQQEVPILSKVGKLLHPHIKENNMLKE